MTTNSFFERRSLKLAVSLGPFLLPSEVAAQGLPVQSASPVPLWVWFIGTGILGLVLAYGIFNNRRRTGAERKVTERATQKLYAEEERRE